MLFLYVININNMQKEERDLESLSYLRQDLRRLLRELSRSVSRSVFGHGPMVKGNVYEIARKCGKPSCACARGQLHRSMVLSWSDRGKTRLIPVTHGRLTELRSKSERYLRFRRARAKVPVLCKQILAAIDHIEKLRLEEP